jgi:hypothetical protein
VLFAVLVALAGIRSACAGNVHVTYVVECPDFLRAGSRLQRGLTLEVYSTRSCERPSLDERFVGVDAVIAPAGRLERLHSTGQSPPPSALMLEVHVALDTPAEFYVRLTGSGVKPVGDACQLQRTDGRHGDVRLARRCPPDAVPSNGVCVDRYEASMWEIPAARVDLLCKVIDGTATVADLTAPGVRQVGFPGAPFNHAKVPGSFLAEGDYATPLYAAALPGVLPTTSVSAFQAWAACGFSGKRLATNDEWTAAGAGTSAHATDDLTRDCNTGAGRIATGGPVKTGSRAGCVSRAGAFDMVGNVSEWTMDGHTRTRYRGGAWDAGDTYGIDFTQADAPRTQDNAVGFRCVR